MAGPELREHRLQPGDTLAGLALRYGVTMEQIQRANRLYSSDTIFLRASLLIPAGPGHPPGPGDIPGDITGDIPGDITGDITGDIPGDITGDIPGDITGDITGDTPQNAPGRPRPELSASDFLRRLDAEIGRSKELTQRLQGENTSPGTGGGGLSPSSPRGARLGPRPLSRNPRAAALRDCEDEIFTL